MERFPTKVPWDDNSQPSEHAGITFEIPPISPATKRTIIESMPFNLAKADATALEAKKIAASGVTIVGGSSMPAATVATVVFGVPTTAATLPTQDSGSTTTVSMPASIVAGLSATAVTASVTDFETKTTAAIGTATNTPSRMHSRAPCGRCT